MKFVVEMNYEEDEILTKIGNHIEIVSNNYFVYYFEVTMKTFEYNMRGEKIVNVEFINKKINNTYTMAENCEMNKKLLRKKIVKELNDIDKKERIYKIY